MRRSGIINGYNQELKGLCVVDKKEFLVSQVIDQEIVEIDITEENYKASQKTEATLAKVIEGSPDRQKPRCPLFKNCGGCQLQHLKYQQQLAIKSAMIKNLFNQDKTLLSDPNKINLCLGMKDPYYYRTKNQIVFGPHPQKRMVSGFYQENTHKIIDFDECYIQDQLTNKIVKVIKNLAIKMHLTAYDGDRKRGLIRHVMVKRSLTTNQVMVIIVTADQVFPGSSNFVKALTAQVKEVTTIIQNVNPRQTSVVLGNKDIVLYGKGYIIDQLCGLKFKISAHSFYQVNPLQTEVLYNTALNLAKIKKTDIVIDAYSGVGTIGLIASRMAKEVISVELVKEAHLDAIGNAKANGINNISFFNEDASVFITNYANKKAKVDVVIMDPPRKGSDLRFLNAVLKLNPVKIIYISCNPFTQYQDIQTLKNNYTITNIQPVDLFPQTNHVENIVVLERKK